jgi:hypothetical protein
MHPDPVPSCYKSYLLMMPNQLARISAEEYVTRTDSNQNVKHVMKSEEEEGIKYYLGRLKINTGILINI